MCSSFYMPTQNTIKFYKPVIVALTESVVVCMSSLVFIYLFIGTNTNYKFFCPRLFVVNSVWPPFSEESKSLAQYTYVHPVLTVLSNVF